MNTVTIKTCNDCPYYDYIADGDGCHLCRYDSCEIIAGPEFDEEGYQLFPIPDWCGFRRAGGMNFVFDK
jgi:hypothetical protein